MNKITKSIIIIIITSLITGALAFLLRYLLTAGTVDCPHDESHQQCGNITMCKPACPNQFVNGGTWHYNPDCKSCYLKCNTGYSKTIGKDECFEIKSYTCNKSLPLDSSLSEICSVSKDPTAGFLNCAAANCTYSCVQGTDPEPSTCQLDENGKSFSECSKTCKSCVKTGTKCVKTGPPCCGDQICVEHGLERSPVCSAPPN